MVIFINMIYMYYGDIYYHDMQILWWYLLWYMQVLWWYLLLWYTSIVVIFIIIIMRYRYCGDIYYYDMQVLWWYLLLWDTDIMVILLWYAGIMVLYIVPLNFCNCGIEDARMESLIWNRILSGTEKMENSFLLFVIPQPTL